ncbi:MAG: succinate dehydrogenase cytochrome b556 large subunit, partial [Plesiomonas shigelloides]
RHLLMDLGFGEENLAVASRSARIAFAITIVLSLLAGVLVW